MRQPALSRSQVPPYISPSQHSVPIHTCRRSTRGQVTSRLNKLGAPQGHFILDVPLDRGVVQSTGQHLVRRLPSEWSPECLDRVSLDLIEPHRMMAAQGPTHVDKTTQPEFCTVPGSRWTQCEVPRPTAPPAVAASGLRIVSPEPPSKRNTPTGGDSLQNEALTTSTRKSWGPTTRTPARTPAPTKRRSARNVYGCTDGD
ncbi:hypothetical protein B0I35DRAFT_52805 [Stachybotrys elegans]|uniref:Uncharacterized protein n=1 Tax=Stachybotrys elegans TaxID=80388 RepID=A0A8K0SHC6_9HYPO|nr:hypothetical protein B0I35DRAFT_52805 [Stachybotrys elegans]